MILTILFISLLVVGIGILIYYNISYCGDWALFLGVLSMVAGFIGALACGILALTTQASLDLDYEKMLQEQQMIEYRLDLISDDEIDTYAEIQLYNDIVNYNRIVLTHRKWAYNNWTNWFYNHKIGHMTTFNFTYE